MAEPTEADRATARSIAGECHCAPGALCGACKCFYYPILAALTAVREAGFLDGLRVSRETAEAIASTDRQELSWFGSDWPHKCSSGVADAIAALGPME